MKKVCITHIAKEQENYVVYLGNGTIHSFSSTRLAKKFLAETNEFLTQTLYEARTVFMDTWNKYQSAWGFFMHNKKSMSSKMSMDDQSCRSLLTQVEKSFNMIIERGHFPNGNYFVFSHLFFAISSQKRILKVLNEMYASRSITTEIYACNNLYKRLMNLEGDVKNYSEIKASGIFKIRIPTHYSEIESDWKIKKLHVA